MGLGRTLNLEDLKVSPRRILDSEGEEDESFPMVIDELLVERVAAETLLGVDIPEPESPLALDSFFLSTPRRYRSTTPRAKRVVPLEPFCSPRPSLGFSTRSQSSSSSSSSSSASISEGRPRSRAGIPDR